MIDHRHVVDPEQIIERPGDQGLRVLARLGLDKPEAPLEIGG